MHLINYLIKHGLDKSEQSFLINISKLLIIKNNVIANQIANLIFNLIAHKLTDINLFLLLRQDLLQYFLLSVDCSMVLNLSVGFIISYNYLIVISVRYGTH